MGVIILGIHPAKAVLFAEAIEFSLILEIGYSNLIIGKTAIGVNLTCIINANASISNSNQILLKSRGPIQDKIIQIPIPAVKMFNCLSRAQSDKIQTGFIYTVLKHGSSPPLAASRARIFAMPRS